MTSFIVLSSARLCGPGAVGCRQRQADPVVPRLGDTIITANMDEAGFVAMRHERDATLAMPVLIWPAIQVNIRAGELPAEEGNGRRYLKIPLDVLLTQRESGGERQGAYLEA